MTNYEPVIGLEVHAELLTRSKMFCGCPVVDSTDAEPNTAVCEICTGMPGTLPAINRRAVAFALRVALALNCEIQSTSVYARKNYFYPDLPKGFQISQYELPLARDGKLTVRTESGTKDVRIRRVHLEEDTGKLFHRDGYSLVDFNRSGVPLLEIVSEPDMNSVEEAHAYATDLRRTLRYLDVNSGDMEKGVIRFEANVSVRPVGEKELGTRVEIKNLNSFRAMTRSLEHEIERQIELHSSGGTVEQQTLGWDESEGVTVPQRSKEVAEDYRYFPEPDLPPLVIEESWLQEIRSSLPALPAQRRQRLIEEYGLTEYTADLLTDERTTADWYERAAESAQVADPQQVAHWLTGELFALLNDAGVGLSEAGLDPGDLADLVDLVESDEINATSGKEVLAHVFENGGSPSDVVAERGLEQESDPDKLRDIVEQVLRENPEQVEEYLQGKETISKWFFGQVMRATKGQANPQVVNEVLSEALDSLPSNLESE
ncbi:MAG: Asp-tRNA(Asn)/Glu-tRNA(Gln) amidotransferase subunit GatB [Anaerolineales bacterium]|nr:Asp-tRNA(Asn)/Glu-tRNA(Gln) amidotransferase subunit GatB [Anaerolineales bacterium]